MKLTNSVQNSFFLFAILFFPFFSFCQNSTIWTKLDAPQLDNMNEIQYRASFKNFTSFSLDKTALLFALQNAPYKNSLQKSNKVVEFPSENGKLENFRMYRTEVMSLVLAAKFPDIKTYSGVSLTNANHQINLTVTPFGVYVMIQRKGVSLFINPQSYHGNVYMLFSKDQAYTDHLNTVACEVQEQLDEDVPYNFSNSKIVGNSTLKRYRLALSCTSQYTNFHIAEAGLATSATDEEKKNAVLAAMIVTMNRVNAVFERDVAFQLQLIDNNDELIQLNSATDPFTNDDTFAMLDENQDLIDLVIGSANYDIGHVFSTGGGGVAGLGSVCNPFFKASGVTGLPSPVGDPFDIDYVAHEMGHQFGATHTFNNSCGGNRTDSTAMEPGSGSTIMAYANICPPNVQGASDDYFHLISVTQMYNFINSGAGGNCSENIQIINNPPTIDTPLQNYTLPVNTPFFLEVEASDLDGDQLTYTWEQLDNEISTQPPAPFSSSGPNFRSVGPSISPRRYFPNLNTVLQGDLSNTWEVLPFLGREMEFGVLVRDNQFGGGQSDFDNTTLTFVSGPFSVTSQNTTDIIWEPGQTETITWNVANTSVPPINSPAVDILLSPNFGQDFNVILAEGIPNNGSAEIIVPDTFAPSCRIMVKGSNSVFYALNSEYFSINSENGLECFDDFNTNVTSIPDGIGSNQAGETTSLSIDFEENSSIIESISVQVDITHTYIQDLVIELVGPNNDIITLFDRNCGSEDGMNVEFNDLGDQIPGECPNPLVGVFQPANGSLNQWIGTNVNGEWTLLVTDFWNGDQGQVNSWGLEVCATNLSIVNVEANQFSIVPNPNKGSFQINFSNLTGNSLSGKLYNLQGKLINTIELQNGVLRQDVILEGLQNGMYLFQIIDGSTSYVEKLIIR